MYHGDSVPLIIKFPSSFAILALAELSLLPILLDVCFKIIVSFRIASEGKTSFSYVDVFALTSKLKS